ncbi:MAG: nucleoside monophosphate kinase [Opitutales bacterium]|nr:nucleoside monophosphate kinase [Opitutales bacterium]
MKHFIPIVVLVSAMFRPSVMYAENEGAHLLSKALGYFRRSIKMAKEAVDFVHNQEFEPFVEQGKLVASGPAVFLFCRVWKRLVSEFPEIKVPRTIIWVNGAPGAGKGTNTRNIMRVMGISTHPIIVSDLLHSPEYQQKIDQGLLIDDEEVTYLVFKKIIEESHNEVGIIIDGYPRTLMQAECAALLQKRIGADRLREITVVLLVDERTSILRQKTRGQEAIEHNNQVQASGHGELQTVRATDMDDNVARTRYAMFRDQTLNALKYMKKCSNYYSIDAKGSFDEVRNRIYEVLKKENAKL